MQVRKHLELLGMPCKDKITGMTGVVTSVRFNLYACAQILVHPDLDEKGEFKDSCWFDVTRVEVTDSSVPVIHHPNFDYGCTAEKISTC